MKKKNIILAALATVVMGACNKTEVIIKGTIEEFSQNEETNISILVRNPLTTDTCHITLSPQGAFEQTLPIEEERELYLMVNGMPINRMLVKGGDLIELTWKGYSPATTLEFADPARKREKELEELLGEKFRKEYNTLSSLSPSGNEPCDTALFEGIERYVDKYRRTIDEFEATHGTLPHKEAFLVDGYFNALSLVQYSLEAMEELKLRGLRSGLPEDTVKGKAAYEVLPAKYLVHRAYRSFLWNWAHLHVRALTEPADSLTTLYERYLERMDTTFRIMQDRETAEWTLAYRAPFTHYDLPTNDALSYLRSLESDLTYPWAKDYVQQTIAKLTPYQAGEQAPDFRLTDEAGRIYTLADFRGKYLYMGFWSQGCRVCHREFKNIPALREKYRAYDDRITYAFVYMERNDAEFWPTHIDRHGSRQGINLRTLNDKDKVYNITGFPTYVLINPEGMIVEYNTARPSELLQDNENVLDKSLKK